MMNRMKNGQCGKPLWGWEGGGEDNAKGFILF